MIKKECIGQTMTVKAPNGYNITITIVDDKKYFKLYKDLKLDVFIKNESKKRNSK